MDLSGNDKKSAIYTMVKFSVKTENGKYKRIKCRLILGGNKLIGSYEEDEYRSNTISTTSVLTMAGVYASENLIVETIDFKSAFLNTQLPLDQHVIAFFDADTTLQIIAIKPDYKRFITNKGGMYVKVTGAMNGHPCAPLAWYNKVSDDL